MNKKSGMSYKHKLFLCFFVVFSLFAAGVLLLEQARERKHKTAALEDRLDAYAGIVHRYLEWQSGADGSADSAAVLLPANMRFTLIDLDGRILYDNALPNIEGAENHLYRPEISAANLHGEGSDIRTSASNGEKYLYRAVRFHDGYIRVALPYDIHTRRLLQADNLFLYYLCALFIVVLAAVNMVSNRFGRSIRRLRNFALLQQEDSFSFPNDELGEIVAQITNNYLQLKKSQQAVSLEHTKLLQHVHNSNEGICFFSARRTIEFYNGLFIQYLNTLCDEANSNPAVLFSDSLFGEITDFLEHRSGGDCYFETRINRQGRLFALRINIFEDDDFEVIINDVTKQQMTRLMKQEITGNVTHELRTPIAGIRGCLETILEHSLPPEKERYFIQSAYNQTLALSELVGDMGLLVKMDEAPHLFRTELTDLQSLLNSLKNDMELLLQTKSMQFEYCNCENVQLQGNRNLLYAIFRNLTDNAIRYAGSNVVIQIDKYNEDSDFYYFSYSDNGAGVEDEHLPRLFERFYRIGEGRTRDSGGSGLGLSIVKNAVLFHKGSITAKNKAGGGLEFLFSLSKRL